MSEATVDTYLITFERDVASTGRHTMSVDADQVEWPAAGAPSWFLFHVEDNVVAAIDARRVESVVLVGPSGDQEAGP